MNIKISRPHSNINLYYDSLKNIIRANDALIVKVLMAASCPSPDTRYAQTRLIQVLKTIKSVYIEAITLQNVKTLIKLA